MSAKLMGIFVILAAGDMITTSEGDFVVCREVNFGVGPYGEDFRYVIGQVCRCGRHCKAVLPYSFAWNEEKDAFCDAKGEPLPGWSDTVTVDRDSYTGRDKDDLHYVRVNDELSDPSPDGMEDLAELSRSLINIAKLSPSPRATWYAMSDALGLNLSTKQMLALAATSVIVKGNEGMMVAIVSMEDVAVPEQSAPQQKH